MKQITLLIALLVCSIGLGQSTAAHLAVDGTPPNARVNATNQNVQNYVPVGADVRSITPEADCPQYENILLTSETLTPTVGDDGALHSINPNESFSSRNMATTLSTLYAGGNGGSNGGAVYFDITVGASDIDITSIDLNTDETGAFTIDVYTLVGTYVGNQDNPGAWGAIAESGSGTAAPVGTPSTATLNAPLTLSAGTTYGMAIVFDATHGHTYTNGDGSNQNYSNADITLDLGSATNVPFTPPVFDPRVFNGGITYDLAGGGGGGGPCSFVNPSVTITNGLGMEIDNGWVLADDFDVAAGDDFTPETLVFEYLNFNPNMLASLDIVFYDDAGGLPGTMVASALGQVAVSQVIIGSAFGRDNIQATYDLTGSGIVLPGGAGTKYWLALAGDSSGGDTAFWTAGDTINGLECAFSSDFGGSWSTSTVAFGQPYDVFFDLTGDCTPTGGADPCSFVNPSVTITNGLGMEIDNGWVLADDFDVAAGDNFTPETLVFEYLNFNPNMLASLDIVFYDDAGGLPGTMVASALGQVAVSQVIIGSAFGRDNIQATYDLTGSGIVLPGGAGTKYWLALAGDSSGGDTAFWTAGDTINGLECAFSSDFGGSWSTSTVAFGQPYDVFFDLSGDCGGAGGACVVAQYDATGLPADIDPGGTSTPDCVNMPNLYPVTVGDPGTIGVDSNIDNVTISITHTFDGDLDISLVAPSGAELLLSGGNGGSGDNFIDTVFMDGAGPLSGGAPPYTGTFEPDGGTFAVAFDGEDILGDWNLKVCDNFGGDTGTVDAFSISICRPDPPSNEECIDAFPVVCGEVVVGTTADNTDNGGFNAAPDEWYSFTGTGSPQIVTVSLCDGGTTYDSRLTVYDVCGGTEIITNDDFCGLQSQLTFLSDGTTTYYIAIEGFSAGNSGPFSMEITCVDPPPNDECPGAISMDCGDTVVGETITASFDATAPVCVTGITAPGVWYEFTDTTGLVTNYTLSMCDGGTDYDSKITVYSGDCGALVCVVDNDDSCGLQSEVSWQGDGLTSYLILVHGFGSSVGNFSMALTCAPVPPPNDMIANSIDVDEIGFPYTDPAVAMPAATTEAGTPAGCDNAGAKGVWYNFVPDADGYATAEIITPGEPSTLFSVNNGPLAGDYVAVAGDFGGAIPNNPLTEDAALVIDDGTSGDENDACDPIINGASLAGKIAVVRRGSCEFGFKALSAQNEGAIAVIVVNNQPGDPIVMGGGANGDDVTIPVVMVSDVDGEPIISELDGGGTVNVSISSNPAGLSHVSFYTAPDENAIETDLTLVDWQGNQCVPGTSAIIPTVAGQAYYVYVTNDAITDIVIDGEGLGADDNTFHGFTYYPNPTDGVLNLNSVESIDNVAIYNLLGQQVLNQDIDATSTALDVSTLAVGAYIMKVSVNGQIGTYKVIKR